MIEFAIAAVPLLLLVAALLLGRYPGCEMAMRLAERIASRARPRATTADNSPRPRPPASHAAHGGQLIALSLAQRPPPLAA
ncbi:MAG TPA: hypothetical protein VKC63_08090 [Solirubrobacterales bacterium]|nr:hypothetical protein [Solirubrobacterales bacterium]